MRPKAKQYIPKSIFKKHHIANSSKAVQRARTPLKSPVSSRKRKRAQEAGKPLSPPSIQSRGQSAVKRRRTSPSRNRDDSSPHHMPTREATRAATREDLDPLTYWTETGRWQKKYFEQDSQSKEDFETGRLEGLRLIEKQQHCLPLQNMHGLGHLRKFLQGPRSLRRKQSQSTLQATSDQLPRDSSNSQYNTLTYKVKLERMGSYMREYSDTGSDNGGTRDKAAHAETYCRSLMETEQTVPQDSLFRDDRFKKICIKIEGRNEAIVLQDIGRLIVPSAENLAIYGATHLEHLHETVNEIWTRMIEYAGTLPKPDYAVGFKRSAFTDEQMNKLLPLVGEFESRLPTYFIATAWMYFPFMTCEVKSHSANLEVADRQNAQSMSIALRAVVALYRQVNREKELDRKLLTFSISHDHSSVRIYGHYPVVKDTDTTFWRKLIRRFDFTDLGGKDKWTAYKFVKNVYELHAPKLLKIICSGVDDLDLPASSNSNLSQPAVTASANNDCPASSSHSSLPQPIAQESRRASANPSLSGTDSQLSVNAIVVSQQVTPNTSFTRASGSASKRLKQSKG